MKKNIDVVKVMVYIFLKAMFGILTKILFSTKVAGKENLPKEGPYIIAANHASYADAAVISVSVPALIRWVAKQDVYNTWYLKPFCKIIGTIVTNGSIEKALKVLEQKDIIGIFPEGTRTDDGKLKKGGIGVAIVALKSGVPIVPVGVSGTFKAFPRHARFPKFHPVVVKIGAPVVFARSSKDVIEEAVLRTTTDEIMAKINELILDI